MDPHRSGRERRPRGPRPRVPAPSPPPGRGGSYLGVSAWPSAPPHRACRAETRRSVPSNGDVLRVESSGPLPLLQHRAQRLQTIVEAATHGANRDTGLGGDLHAGPVTIVGLYYRVTVVWTYVPQRLLYLPRAKGLLCGVFRLMRMLHLLTRPLRARRTCPGQVYRDVAGDSEHPGPQSASLRVVAVGGAPGPQEGLLHRLFCQTIIVQCSVRDRKSTRLNSSHANISY